MKNISSFQEQINSWCEQDSMAVALRLRERLVPVEGDGAVFFPPTYAPARKGEPSAYNVDPYGETKTVLVDSVGSQANRIEPLFMRSSKGRQNLLAELVPQIDFNYANGKKAVSIFEVGHRLGDAFVRSTELAGDVEEAFKKFVNGGDATEIAKLAPTSLVFGVWDSRGTHAKLPRIFQSSIRAWDVCLLTRSAQYSPPVDYVALGIFSEDDKKKAEEDSKNPLAQAGFAAVPAINTHGGVCARGPIERTATVNLVALRRLTGAGDYNQAVNLRRYILGLALVAATIESDPFLRQGCLLVNDTKFTARWELVERNGTVGPMDLEHDAALAYATSAARDFGVGENREVSFTPEMAQKQAKATKDKKKKGEDSQETQGKK